MSKTTYDPSYPAKLVALMETGLSVTAACGELGIVRARAYSWMETHPEWADAMAMGKAKRLVFWERRLISAQDGPVVTSCIFALKNADREEWRDKQITEHVGKDETPLPSSDDRLAQALALLMAKSEK